MEHTAIYRKERGVYAASTILTQRSSKFISAIVDRCTVNWRKGRSPMSRQLYVCG
jgi:hypothetical protein